MPEANYQFWMPLFVLLGMKGRIAVMQDERNNIDNPIGASLVAVGQAKAHALAIGQHRFHDIKKVLCLQIECFEGLAKKTAELFTLFGLAKLLIVKKGLLASIGQNASCSFKSYMFFPNQGGRLTRDLRILKKSDRLPIQAVGLYSPTPIINRMLGYSDPSLSQSNVAH